MIGNATLRILSACMILLGSAAYAAASEQSSVIDTPTTAVLNHGQYNLNFRLFSNGGVLTRLDFGVFKIVTLGLGWELARLIGDQNVTVGPPALYFKVRPYAGGTVMPALALGYDGQGYFYDKDSRNFLQKEKGLFLVAGREVFIEGLELNLGANMNDFGAGKVYGFTSLSMNFDDTFYILGEYDNINYLPDARINAGIRFFVKKSLSIDLAGRDIGAAGRSAERIARINYTGKF